MLFALAAASVVGCGGGGPAAPDASVAPDASAVPDASVAPDAIPECTEAITGGEYSIPVDGILNEDFYLVNYVDNGETATPRDAFCGAKTYAGSVGTEFVLPSFAAMDQGVSVTAAAAGTVTDLVDGLDDRNVVFNPLLSHGNYVEIQHSDGTKTLYAHLAKNSVSVSLGEDVQHGSPLGQIGSSGNSTIPHLQLLFDQAGEVVDPFSGPCNCKPTLWDSQEPYDDEFSVIASGLMSGEPTINELKLPPDHLVDHTAGGDVVSFWVQTLNLPRGSRSEFTLYDPDGQFFWSTSIDHDEFFPLSWWWAYYPTLAINGGLLPWKFVYSLNGEVVVEQEFFVRPSTAAVVSVVSDQPGVGGGNVDARP